MKLKAIRPIEAKALMTAVDFMNAGPAEGVSQRMVKAADEAATKIGAAPDKTVWVPFSSQELHMLCVVIDNGAEGVLQSTSGTTSAQKRAFRDGANRIADTAGFGGSRF